MRFAVLTIRLVVINKWFSQRNTLFRQVVVSCSIDGENYAQTWSPIYKSTRENGHFGWPFSVRILVVPQPTINLVWKVVAIGMAIPSIILVALDGGSLETSVTLLAIGLLALALAYLSESE